MQAAGVQPTVATVEAMIHTNLLTHPSTYLATYTLTYSSPFESSQPTLSSYLPTHLPTYLQLWESMQAAGVQPTVATVEAMIRVLGYKKQWQQATTFIQR